MQAVLEKGRVVEQGRVAEQGRVVELGRHADLLTRTGRYAASVAADTEALARAA